MTKLQFLLASTLCSCAAISVGCSAGTTSNDGAQGATNRGVPLPDGNYKASEFAESNVGHANLPAQFGSGRSVTATEYDLNPQAYNQRDYASFVKERCVTLGMPLSKLENAGPDLREVLWRQIHPLKDRDDRILRDFARAGKAPSGLVIPRYIHRELNKPKEERDLKWLSQQGRMLLYAYDLETKRTSEWRPAIKGLLAEGEPGKEFLAAQMVKRLSSADPNEWRKAQDVLLTEIPATAIEPLVFATHLDIPLASGVFPKRTADTLAKIGERSQDTIIAQWFGKDGAFVATSPSNWKARRYFVAALGRIGTERGVKHLIRDYESMDFSDEVFDDKEVMYRVVVLDAFKDARSPLATDTIRNAWRENLDEETLILKCKEALIHITGRRWDSPDGRIGG